MENKNFDVIIVGGGMAGMSASIYARRFGMSCAVVSMINGGLIATTHLVENYPGFPSLSGSELAMNLKKHADYFDVPFISAKVNEIKKEENNFTATLNNGEVITGKSVILATGTFHRRLGAKGEGQLSGKGVSYCTVCDAMFFTGKDVAVIGGSDSACKQALYLANMVNNVKMLYRGDELKGEIYNIQRVKDNEKIEEISGAEVDEFLGTEKLEKIILKDGREFPLDGCFIEIGYLPQNELAKQLSCDINEKGEIITGAHGDTSVSGVFAAGDITAESFKQAITAASQGVLAAKGAFEYTSKK